MNGDVIIGIGIPAPEDTARRAVLTMAKVGYEGTATQVLTDDQETRLDLLLADFMQEART